MKIKIASLVFLMPVFLCSRSFAWGKKGHELAAEIAFKLLDNKTQKNVTSALGGFSFQGASTWMDEQRDNTAYDQMKPWHYIEFNADQEPSQAKQNNIVTTLNNAIDLISNKQNYSAFEVQQSLLYIFHLMGDIQQPLHCAYKSDLGGNTDKVNCFGMQWPTNLHHVWDDEIIFQNRIDITSCMETYKSLSMQTKSRISQGGPIDWVMGSRLLLPIVYDFENNSIDKTYLIKNKAVVELQLVKAGINLAELLKQNFK